MRAVTTQAQRWASCPVVDRGLLWDRQGLGFRYSHQWPFDDVRYVRDLPYALGVNNAIRDPRYSRRWRSAARALREVLARRMSPRQRRLRRLFRRRR